MRTLETQRLILRDWEISDLDDYFEFKSNPNVTIPDGEAPRSREQCLSDLRYFNQHKNNYAIEIKTNGKVIGSVGVNEDALENSQARNLGFILHEGYWGQGIMTEALNAIVANAHEYTEFLSCGHSLDNSKSEHIINKLGFQFVQLLHDVPGAYGDFHINKYYIKKVT